MDMQDIFNIGQRVCGNGVLTLRLAALFLVISVVAASPLFAVDFVGRPVKVATIAIGYGGDYEEKMALALAHLDTAGARGVDIACLPEVFTGGAAEPVPGPTTDAVAAVARAYGMYVVCPILESDGDKEYNTAVLIDREGRVAGRYRKVFVFWDENVHAGKEGVPVFDTDFGRIAILTCFDLNFPELWQEAERLDAEIVFWPSAYGGGVPLKGYASIHAYYIVSVGDGDFIDMTGAAIPPDETPRDRQFIATLDLDRTLVHKDYTRDKIRRLLDDHEGDIVLEKDWHPEGWFMLRAVTPGVKVRALLHQYDIETLRAYRRRSREQINSRREAGARIAADSAGAPR